MFAPDILLVAATIIGVFSLSSIIAAWTVRSISLPAVIGFAVSGALFFLVHYSSEEGLGWLSVPDAFIAVAARILN